MTGKVQNTQFLSKGYVFVSIDANQPRNRRSTNAFLHQTAFQGTFGLLVEGDVLEFTLEKSDRGPRAVDARLI